MLFSLLSFFLGCSGLLLAAPAEIKIKKAQLHQVGQQIRLLQQTIDENKQQEMNLQQQLKEAETSIGNLSNQIREINKLFLKEQQALIHLKKTQQAFSIKLKIQHAALTEQLQSAYKLGQAHAWNDLVNQENRNTIKRHLVYYRYLSQTRAELISSIKETIAKLNSTITITKRQEKNIEQLLNQKRQQQHQQQHLMNIRQQLVTQVNKQTKSKQERLTTLLLNQKILRETIAKLSIQPIQINGLKFSQLHQKLSWPVKGHFITQFGTPLHIGEQNSAGVIISAAPGSPVHAIYAGKVIFASWLRGLGLLVIINHGDNYMSLYARNQTIYAKVGDYVNSGDVIAAVGNTGGYQNSSLYFEIRQNGTPVDPTRWCH